MSYEELDAFTSCELHASGAWLQIVPNAVKSISEWLDQEIVHESLDEFSASEGFSIDVFPKASHSMRPTWRGVLGGAIVDGKPLISLVMFFVLGDKRLRTVDGQDYSEFVYNGGGVWKLLGTFKDEYGEFENF
jgi:hypothetical protein